MISLPSANIPKVGKPVARWAIVGTGAIASSFAADVRHVPGAELAAVCSRQADTAEAFARTFGAARCFASIEDLAIAADIDVVYIATPNDAHFEQAQHLIAVGKNLLVEKPLVSTVDEAVHLQRLASENGVFLMEALWTVFLPAIGELRDLLASGLIGTVRGVDAGLSYRRPFDPKSRFFSPERGGGSMLDLGIYPLALALNLFGEPRSFDGWWKAAPSGVDLSAGFVLAYDGFSASLSCGFDHNGTNRFVIHGTKGTLVVDGPFLKANRILHVTNGAALGFLTSKRTGLAAKVTARLARMAPGVAAFTHPFSGNGLQFEIEAVGQALREGRREHPSMPLSASIAALRIIEAVRSGPPL